MKKFFLIMIFCLGQMIMVSGQEQQAQKLLSEAIYQEEVNGKLDEAIKTYQLIINKYSDNRKVSAEALLHLGLCYEKLGNQEAVKTYNRLVSNYPEQKNEVAIARERLSRLNLVAEIVSGAPLIPKFTKINIPTMLSWNVALSPDGKNLALVSEKKLWLMPLSGNIGQGIPGKPVQVNTEGVQVDWSGMAWSGNSKWIAFNEDNSDSGRVSKSPEKEKFNQKIFIIPSSGGKPKKIVDNYRSSRVVNYRISLSPDGSNLAYSSIEDNKQHIFSAKVPDGTPKRLVDFQSREPVFSPDGKMIAFVEDKNLGSLGGGLGLWTIPSQGGTPHLVAKAEYASSPVWSPDGTTIAFLDNSKNKQIFFVQLPKEKEIIGNVTNIDIPEETQEVRLLTGWTKENKLGALMTSKQEFAIFTLPATGGQAAIIANDCYASQPRWSSDGKQIYYSTIPKEGVNRAYHWFLATVPSNGGTGTPLPRDKQGEGQDFSLFAFQGGNRVSPDGKWIVSAAFTPKDSATNYPRTKIWKIAVDGSKSFQITNTQGSYADLCPSWSSDGTKIAYIRTRLTGDDYAFGSSSILMMNSSGGESRILIPESDKCIFSPVWSPDGTMIAYLTASLPTAELPNLSNPSINIININTGKAGVVGKVPRANVNIELAWSPDSKRIAFNGDNLIKVINVDDGKIEDIKTNLVNAEIWHLDWSRDGEQFVFSGAKGGNPEFWFIENFLPLEKLAQKSEKENVNESEGVKIRQVWTGQGVDNSGSVSADGVYLSFTNWETGNLAIRNLKTGETRQLTNDATWNKPQQYAEYSLISPDGKQVAYLWFNDRGDKGIYELRSIKVGNQTPTVLYYCSKDEYLTPELWLSDGKKIIFQKSDRKNKIWQLFSIDVANKEVQLLKEEISPFWINNLSLSPDEKYIAFELSNPSEKRIYDIHLMSIDSKTELPLVEHPANDKVLGWIPKRKEFLFISDRSGTRDIWAVSVDDGKPSGPVKRIYNDLVEVNPMGLTQNGECFFGFFRRTFYTHIVPFNSETGELKVESGKSLTGSNIWVKWSPDGQYLTYTKEDSKADNPWQLIIQDLKTSEERKVAINLIRASSPCWSPDGNSILVVGTDKTESRTQESRTQGYKKGGIYKTDVRTGQTTEILNLSDLKYNAPEDESFPISDVECSSDGKSIFYLLFTDRLVKRDLETGEEKILYKHSRFVRGALSRSPDGKNLLFGVFSPEEKKSRLLTIPVEGGTEKEMCASQEALSFNTAMWSPDGKYIYFSERKDGTNLWRVSAEGGMPQKVGHLKNTIEGFSIHPDGTQIAFGTLEESTEIRVIQNLIQELEKLEKLP